MTTLGAVVVACVTMLLGGCSTGDAPAGPGAADAGTETVAAADARRGRPEARPSVTFGATDWTGARITAALAELLVERRLGYPVSVVPIGDNREMVADLATGELDAVLEVWPADVEPATRAQLNTDAVTALGPLGVVAKAGWFVPRYMVDQDDRLGRWEAYQRPETARQFATAQTGSRGRFLGTDPAWEQYDEEIIAALDLPFQVVYSGSEAATVADVATRTATEQPVLLYWWTPSAEVRRFDLVPVQLPDRDEACEQAFENGGEVGCEYREETVIKVGAADLALRLPDLHRFLSRFTLTTEQQLDMIDQVDNQGMTVAATVQRWADANPDVWEPWLES